MIFRQLFDSISSTYSYVLASRRGGEALIIDPVLEKVDRYLKLMEELDLRLVKAVDTHLHADHITGLGALRDRTHCVTVMGEESNVDVVSMRIADGDKLTVEGLSLDVLYTPGHTDDSDSFHFGDRVFTGDTLLIRGTGRTDFQNGDSRAQYESCSGCRGCRRKPSSFRRTTRRATPLAPSARRSVTIRASRFGTPAIRGSDGEPQPAEPEDDGRRRTRQHPSGAPSQEEARTGWAFSADEAKALVWRPDIALIDLREKSERDRTGAIPGSLHAPYAELMDNIGEGGLIHELARSGKAIVFYCAFGERSAMAVQAAQDQGLASARHIEGGIAAWTKAGGATR